MPPLRIVSVLWSVVLVSAASASLPYTVDGDSINKALEGLTGNAERGRAIVGDRSRGLCLLCHTGPFDDEHMHGTLAPDLRGAGSRWSEGQLRLRLADNKRVNPGTIMPSFHNTDGLERVAGAWKDKPVLSAQEVEDVVAFLMTLKEP